jgi:hypothetical protein
MRGIGGERCLRTAAANPMARLAAMVTLVLGVDRVWYPADKCTLG